MTIAAELADGTILEFPDGTDPNVIQNTVKGILSQNIQRERTPTDEIDTRTGKPATEWTPSPAPEPDFSTYFKQMLVDNPQTKLDIFSKARFPDLSPEERQKRYRIHEGEVVYLGDDNKWRPETSGDFLSQAKKFIGSEAGRPSNYTIPIGAAAGGLGGAAAGGVVGEGIRKLVGSAVFEEPQTLKQNLIDVTTEGLLGGLTEGIAQKLFVGIPNKIKMRKGKDLLPAVQRDLERGFLTEADQAKAEVIKNLAESYNITLAPHQLYDKESMTNIWKYLRKHPQTSNAVKKFDDQLSGQVEDATEGVIRDIAGPTQQTPFNLGEDIQAAATNAITKAEAERSAAVQGLYDKAFELPGNPETMQNVINSVDQLMAESADTKVKGILGNVKKSLMTDPAPVDPGILKGLVDQIPDYPMTFDYTKVALNNLKNSKNLSASDLAEIEKISSGINKVIASGQSTKNLPGIYKTLNEAMESGVKIPDEAIAKIKKGIDADVKKLSSMNSSSGMKDFDGKLVDTDKLAKEYTANLKRIAAEQKKTAGPDIEAMAKALDKRGIPSMRQYSESDKSYAERITGDFKRIFKSEPIIKGGGSDLIPVFQGRSKKGLTEFTNPDGVAWGSTEKETAEQFADVVEAHYPNRTPPETTKEMRGQVYDLYFDIKNPMEVNIKETLWDKTKELAKVKEAKSKGHDGLKVLHDNGKIDYVAFNKNQVKTATTSNPQIANLEMRNAQIKEILGKAKPGKDVSDLINKYNQAALQPQGKVADTNLKRLQEAKFEIDDLIDGVSYDAAKVSPSSKKFLNQKLNRIKSQLIAAMDEPTGGLYTEANNKFAELSDPINRMRKSVVGEISKLKADGQLSKIPRKLLSPAAMTDTVLLKEALTTISKESPELGNRIAGGYVRDIYESLKATEGGNVANVAGKMHKALFGTKKQKALLKTALDPVQYKNLEGLMTVFKRAAIGSGSESMTAGFQAIEKDLSKTAGGKIAGMGKAAFTPLQSAKEMIFDRWNDLIVMGNQEKLLTALKSDQATRLIGKMKPLKPGTQKYVRTIGTLFNLLIAKAGMQKIDNLNKSNYPIEQGLRE